MLVPDGDYRCRILRKEDPEAEVDGAPILRGIPFVFELAPDGGALVPGLACRGPTSDVMSGSVVDCLSRAKRVCVNGTHHEARDQATGRCGGFFVWDEPR